MNIDERSSMKSWDENGGGGESRDDSPGREHADRYGDHEGYSNGGALHGESDGQAHEYRDRVRGRDAARISTLMGSGTNQGAELPGASIPLPEFSDDADPRTPGAAEESGAMTLEGYQRIRKGYERGINPEALEQMEERQSAMRQFPPPAPSYAESTRLQPGSAPVTGAVNGLYKPEEAEDTGYQRNHYEPYSGQEAVTPVASSSNRRFGPLAVTLLLFVGIVGGLLLYVGGGDLIAGLFRSGQTEPEENLTLVTERPGAAETEATSFNGLPVAGDLPEDEMVDLTADELPEDSEAMPAEGEMENEAAAVEEREELERQRAAEEAKRQEEEARRAEAAAEQRAAEKRAREQAAREKAEAAKRAAAQDAATETSGSDAKSDRQPSVRPLSSAGGTWVVQVRATTDKSEADRIARSLRSKGGDDVHIIATEKDGGTLYRVRFGAFDSQDGAKRTAGSYGYSDVWVMKR